RPVEGVAVILDECLKDCGVGRPLGNGPGLCRIARLRLWTWLRRGTGRRSGPCRQIEVEAPPQRRVLPWHLPVLRGIDYIVADFDEQRTQVIVRGCNTLHEGAGERRVPARAVGCDVAGLGGETDERAGTRFHLREASADVRRARTHGAGKVAGERIVAAGLGGNDVL